MTNDLITIFKQLLSSMSYYNAAESTWSEETEYRNQVKSELRRVASNLRRMGVDPKAIADSGGYLVSESDYK